MTSEFKLFPEEAHFWSFNDYRCVRDVTHRLQARSVLEFGPGNSTLALIEGGATKVDTCEDDPVWAGTYIDRIVKRFPAIVTMMHYTWTDPVSVPMVDGERYDMALIDGPFGTERRPAVIEYCIARCDHVLVCCEDLKGPGLKRAILDIALKHRLGYEHMVTGRLAGSFILLDCRR